MERRCARFVRARFEIDAGDTVTRAAHARREGAGGTRVPDGAPGATRERGGRLTDSRRTRPCRPSSRGAGNDDEPRASVAVDAPARVAFDSGRPRRRGFRTLSKRAGTRGGALERGCFSIRFDSDPATCGVLKSAAVSVNRVVPHVRFQVNRALVLKRS